MGGPYGSARYASDFAAAGGDVHTVCCRDSLPPGIIATDGEALELLRFSLAIVAWSMSAAILLRCNHDPGPLPAPAPSVADPCGPGLSAVERVGSTRELSEAEARVKAGLTLGAELEGRGLLKQSGDAWWKCTRTPCSPGAIKCVAGRRERCANDGARWDQFECNGFEICLNGDDSGKCVRCGLKDSPCCLNSSCETGQCSDGLCRPTCANSCTLKIPGGTSVRQTLTVVGECAITPGVYQGVLLGFLQGPHPNEGIVELGGVPKTRSKASLSDINPAVLQPSHTLAPDFTVAGESCVSVSVKFGIVTGTGLVFSPNQATKGDFVIELRRVGELPEQKKAP